MGFQKKSVGGWGELYPVWFLIFFNFFNLQSPLDNIYWKSVFVNIENISITAIYSTYNK